MEAIIGLFILTIVLLSGAQLFRVHVEHLALVERARRADEQAHITMNALAASSFSAATRRKSFQVEGDRKTPLQKVNQYNSTQHLHRTSEL